MEINLLGLVGIGLATMFFGYFFGLFEGRGQGYKRRKQEETDQSGVDTATHGASPSAAARPPGERTLLNLSLGRDQRPQLELDGRRFDTASLPPEQRQRLVDLMLFMRPWAEAAQPSSSAGDSRPLSSPSSAPLADRFHSAARSTPSGAPPAVPLPAPKAPTAAAPGTPTTMVAQIDAILQSRLTGSALAGLGIRLVESAEGGAAVIVGEKSYTGVGEVTDPAVKAVIKAAIAEWEDKYTPV
jgi:hypothetical protein